MDLEGTRHEKAFLVVIAFIIGFTCAFITFALRPTEVETVIVELPTTESPEAPLMEEPPMDMTDYVPPTENPPSDASLDTPASDTVSYEEGKLYAHADGERFLLSLRTDVMPADNVEGFSTQGIHESLPAYSAAPGGEYVHFCEQQTAEPNCTHFVFSIPTNSIHFVNYNGEKVTTPIDEAMNAYWNGNTLVIGTLESATSDKPWSLTEATSL